VREKTIIIQDENKKNIIMEFLNELTTLNSASSSPIGTPRADWNKNSSTITPWGHMPISFSEDSNDALLMFLDEGINDQQHEPEVSYPQKKRRKTKVVTSETVIPIQKTKKKQNSTATVKRKARSPSPPTNTSDGNSSSGGESVQSTGSGSGVRTAGKKRSIEETRASHRAIERRRTRRLNDLIQQIKSEVHFEGMTCRKDKASILQAAIECIHSLRSKAEGLSARLEIAKMREKAYLVSHARYLQSDISADSF